MQIDLSRLAQRLAAAAAAARAEGLTVIATHTELILSRDGFGTGRSESVAYPSLFLQEDDLLAQALDRLEQHVARAA